MNRFTAYRTFGNPGYSPSKGRIRLYDSRYYIVTFQNVEHDAMTDYHGLAEGEYTQILRGDKARQARDARLNHCNAITDYHGPVWEFQEARQQPEWYGSEAALDMRIAKVATDHAQWMADCEAYAQRHEAWTAEKEIAFARRSGIGIARIDDPVYLQEAVETHQRWAVQTRKAMRQHGPASYTTQRIR